MIVRLTFDRPLEEDIMLAWLEVSVKRRYDVGAFINVNLSFWLRPMLFVPRLKTDTCNNPGHFCQDWMFVINVPNPTVFIRLMRISSERLGIHLSIIMHNMAEKVRENIRLPVSVQIQRIFAKKCSTQYICCPRSNIV